MDAPSRPDPPAPVFFFTRHQQKLQSGQVASYSCGVRASQTGPDHAARQYSRPARVKRRGSGQRKIRFCVSVCFTRSAKTTHKILSCSIREKGFVPGLAAGRTSFYEAQQFTPSSYPRSRAVWIVEWRKGSVVSSCQPGCTCGISFENRRTFCSGVCAPSAFGSRSLKLGE